MAQNAQKFYYIYYFNELMIIGQFNAVIIWMEYDCVG